MRSLLLLRAFLVACGSESFRGVAIAPIVATPGSWTAGRDRDTDVATRGQAMPGAHAKHMKSP